MLVVAPGHGLGDGPAPGALAVDTEPLAQGVQAMDHVVARVLGVAERDRAIGPELRRNIQLLKHAGRPLGEYDNPVRQKYGFGRFDAPLPKQDSFLKDPDRPFRWIAYNPWMNDQFIATRGRLSRALHEADPQARLSVVILTNVVGESPVGSEIEKAIYATGP